MPQRKAFQFFSLRLVDSIVGFHLWMCGQDNTLKLNPLRDTHKFVDIVFATQKVGMILLGGGWPKHYTLFANTFQECVDCAIQITMNRPELRSLSGVTSKR
jgi:deoxyhypusine synthase